MEEWKKYRYSDLCSIIGGGTPKTSEPTYWNGAIPWLSVKDFGNENKYVYETEKHITEKGLNNSSTKLLQKGDIIISARGTVGELAVIPFPMAFNQSCFGIRANSLVDSDYLYYLTKTIVDELKTKSHGSVFDTITRDTFEQIECVIPCLIEQKKIASILSSLDDKIELNNRINHNLEEQAQALYKSWFIDFEPFKDVKFVDSELGMIPEGWHVGTLSELGDIIAGGTPSKARADYYTDNGIHWLTPKDLSNRCDKYTSRGEIDITELGYNNSSAKLMPRGSVLFSSRAPIGYITIAKNDICTNQGFKSVIPKYAGTYYIYYWLSDNTDSIESQASGSTFKEASGALMKCFPALIPPKKILDSFEKRLEPLMHQQEILEEEIHNLSSMRDHLLPDLLSGVIATH